MSSAPKDFIRQRIERDRAHSHTPVVTRFPPEPNGYLHIGHAKSICLNFGVAEEYGGHTYLRFDDTNPLKESLEYVEAIKRDVAWLGFDWGGRETYASDYFEQLFQFAGQLIKQGQAYVDSQNSEDMREGRGSLTEPGKESPYRNRTIAENLDLFQRMRDGEFADGAHVVRARIDMAAANINLRDPVLYRIRHVNHQRTGDAWCIYPMYDFTHCVCDALEGISHSLCTLEFEDHRPLYDWVLDSLGLDTHPPQIEFSRLGLEYTVMSKRLLHRLVDEGFVEGWDDPRMPTIAGLRRRGVTPAAIRDFCQRIGVTKQENLVEMGLLDYCIRQDLEVSAPRAMAVLDPICVTVTNYPDNRSERLEAPWHPQRPELGIRQLMFGRKLYIERDDFAQQPPPKYKRLTPGGMVRLRYGYILQCEEVIVDEQGRVSELKCRYVPESRSGQDTSGLKPKGVIHWVSADSDPAEIHLFERLFTEPSPSPEAFTDALNPESHLIANGLVERAVARSESVQFQFERTGYFVKDSSKANRFNRTVSLRDSYKPG